MTLTDKREAAKSAREFTVIAHRGDSAAAPENTFASFDLALEKGFDNFELDVQLTADGVPVVIHDALLDRTTSGEGPVAAITFPDIRQLDAGSWKRVEFGGQRVPSLEGVLERYAGKARLHLELKSRQQRLADTVAPLIREYGWDSYEPVEYQAPGLTITSFFVEQLHRSLAVMPEMRHGWLLERITPTDIDLAVKLGITGIYPRADCASAETVNMAVASGLSVRCWGIGDSEEALMAAYHSGATGTTVDWPDKASNLLGTGNKGR